MTVINGGQPENYESLYKKMVTINQELTNCLNTTKTQEMIAFNKYAKADNTIGHLKSAIDMFINDKLDEFCRANGVIPQTEEKRQMMVNMMLSNDPSLSNFINKVKSTINKYEK